MKTVVITGSTRGLGFEMAKLFRKNGYNVVINGVNPARLESSLETLKGIEGNGSVEGLAGNVTLTADIQALADFASDKFGNIDVWINNVAPCISTAVLWSFAIEAFVLTLTPSACSSSYYGICKG